MLNHAYAYHAYVHTYIESISPSMTLVQRCVYRTYRTWWRHQMETFSALLALCAGNSPVSGEFPAQRPVTRSFDVFFDLRLNKRLSKQWWGWWIETLSSPLWRHCNETVLIIFALWCHPPSPVWFSYPRRALECSQMVLITGSINDG